MEGPTIGRTILKPATGFMVTASYVEVSRKINKCYTETHENNNKGKLVHALFTFIKWQTNKVFDLKKMWQSAQQELNKTKCLPLQQQSSEQLGQRFGHFSFFHRMH